MTALSRKLRRDLFHQRGQVIAIGLVVACGVAVFVTTRTAYDSLLFSQATYYAEYRFADVFSNLKRAPQAVGARIAAIPGVDAVRTRLVFDVTLDVPGVAEPATGRLVSIPERHGPMLNDLYIRRGRYIEPGRRDEVLVSEAFADANRLDVGDTLGAVLNGRWERLRIVGVALSPEYVYEIRGSDIFPDNKRFGVLWMSREAMGPAFDMDGAFNDVVLSLAPGAVEGDVIRDLDRLLDRYGGLGAYGRHDQISHRFLSDEIAENRIFGTILPAIFLGVAAFLLNVVLSRLVSLQRDQIAVLKALGYNDFSVGLHYLEFALVAVFGGAVGGSGLGLWLGAQLNQLYVEFYRFPVLRYQAGPAVVVLACGIAAAAALLGAWAAVRRALALTPAEAMRPEPPPGFRAGMLERSGLQRVLSVPVRMILRNIMRRPLRAGLSLLGIAFAVAILILGRYFVDAIQRIADVQFRIVQRDDVTVAFHDPLPARARHDIRRLPGVLVAEPYRAVPVRLRFEHRTRRTALVGLDPGTQLHRLIGRDLRPIEVPDHGVLLTTKLADLLGASRGDVLTVAVLEGQRQVRQVPVVGSVDELVGVSAYMSLPGLSRLLRDGGTVSGAFLRVDALATPRLYADLKRLPAVSGVTLRKVALASFEETLARSMGIFTSVLIVFACVIAVAVVYNAARIALSERARELASLRLLGFTRGEVSVMLLGEQAILTVLAIPLGYLIGFRLCVLLASAYQWELFRLPLFVSTTSYAFACLVVV
ncbi:MAG: ABC transporter permease, partial [Candidatus Binatia bacterium]